MNVLKKMILVFAVILISAVLWVGTEIYLGFTSTQLRGELLGSETVYQFLSKGMLDEVTVSVIDEENMPVDGVAVDILEPIDPHFSMIGFEKVVEKIKENLIVSPEEFHKLQAEAVMRGVEIGDSDYVR